MKKLFDNILYSNKTFEPVTEDRLKQNYLTLNILFVIGVVLTLTYFLLNEVFALTTNSAVNYQAALQPITGFLILRYLSKQYYWIAITYTALYINSMVMWNALVFLDASVIVYWYLAFLIPTLYFYNKRTVMFMLLAAIAMVVYFNTAILIDPEPNYLYLTTMPMVFGTAFAFVYDIHIKSTFSKLETLNAELEETIKEQTLERTKVLEGEKKLLDYKAHYDYLTNLPNRSLFQKVLDDYFSTQDFTDELALLFIDLNRFKQINDTYGHSVGDSVLQTVAQRISFVLEDSMNLFRLGGDEFIIIIENFENKAELELLCEKILDTLEESIKIDEYILSIFCSIGISIAPQDTHIKETLIRYADLAMLEAKKFPSGKYLFYETLNN